MASSHTVMHLQRKLKDLQQGRCEAGGSQDSRILGTVVPTLRTAATEPMLILPRGPHRPLPRFNHMPTVERGALEDSVTDMRTLGKTDKDPKDSANTGQKVQFTARDSVQPGRIPSRLCSESVQPGRSEPVVPVHPLAVTPDPWRTDCTQTFPNWPPISFVPPSSIASSLGGYYFQRDLPANTEFSRQRDVLWPLPGTSADATMPPSSQYQAYLPHIPLQPLLYRLDTSSLGYMKTPLQASELSAFSPFRLFHPLPTDPVSARLSSRRMGHRDGDTVRSRKPKERMAKHKTLQSRLLPRVELEFLKKKDRNGQKKVTLGKAPSQEERERDKDEVDVGPWLEMSLQEPQREKSRHLFKEEIHPCNPLPVQEELRNGLSGKDSEKCSPQVESRNCQRKSEVPNSWKALDLSPRFQQNKHMDRQQISKCTSRWPPLHQEVHILPRGPVEERIPMPSGSGTSPRLGHRAKRCTSMPNLLLTHGPQTNHKLLKDLGETAVGMKEGPRKDDINLNGVPSQDGANLNIREMEGREPTSDIWTLTQCTNESIQADRTRPLTEERSEESAREIFTRRIKKAGKSVTSAGISRHDSQEICSLIPDKTTAKATIKASRNVKRRLSTVSADSPQPISQKMRSIIESPALLLNYSMGGPPLAQTDQKNLLFTLLDVKPQIYSDNREYSVPGLAPSKSQKGREAQDLSTASTSGEEEPGDMSSDCGRKWRPRWQGIEAILETYKCYVEERIFEEKILQEQLRLSKEKNNELSLTAKNLSTQMQSLQASKESLKMEQRGHEAALAYLRKCLTLV